jgi:hypothetical protein
MYHGRIGFDRSRDRALQVLPCSVRCSQSYILWQGTFHFGLRRYFHRWPGYVWGACVQSLEALYRSLSDGVVDEAQQDRL